MSSIIKGLQNEQNDFQVNVPGYGTVPLEMLKRHVKELSKDFNGMIQSEEFIKAAYKTEQFYNALFALSKAMKAKSVEEGYSAGITGGSGLGIEKSPMEKVIEKPLGEGEVVSMQARKTPLVLAGNPFDWDIYDLRTGKVVANLLGGDRHDSPLYEIRINRNGLARDAKMKPTYVATGDVNGDGPHGIYELAVPGKVDKIEKSPGPGGTTKLKPDAMDVVSHIAKGTGEGKYYGYDLVRVSDDDAYTWIEKVLGAKIMDVDDAMEAGYTDVDPEDPAGIIYTADQQDESYTAGLDEKINTPGGMGQSYRKFTPKSAGVDESKLNELSPETLARYKKAAGADATKADKEGDFKRGNKRFSGIVRATKKEFDKPTKESSIMKGLQTEGNVTRWSKDNPPPPELLLNTLVQILMKPENQKSPQDLISLWNDKYGLKHTLGGLKQYAQNDYKKMELSKALQKAALANESSER
jgi:hypothetical protein